MNGILHSLDLRLRRNQYGIYDIPSVKNKVNIEYCHLVNAGDVLGPVIVEWMLRQRKIDPSKRVDHTKHLMTVGSIIGRGRFDTAVWGSGVLKGNEDHRLKRNKKLYHRKIDFRAVRGPYTRDIVLKSGYACPEVYGDPAVLMPMIYPSVSEKQYDVSIILHHRTTVAGTGGGDGEQYQLVLPERMTGDPGLHFIDPKTEDYQGFIDELARSRRVISSSLHGVILAEAYGVPAVFLNWGMDDQQTKFRDWYASTGRPFVYAQSLEEALGATPPELPDLTAMQQNLMDSFPYDLWES